MSVSASIPNMRGTVVIGATASDAHVVSLFLATLMMQDEGYEVVNRGCQNSTEELFELPQNGEPPLCYVIVNQNGHAESDLRDLPEVLKRAAPGVPVALAGHYVVGTNKSTAARQRAALSALGIDVFLDRMGDLLPFLDEVCRQREEGGMGMKVLAGHG